MALCWIEGMDAGRILLTADKDFGELVFRQRLEHSGINRNKGRTGGSHISSAW
jgi:hypothetical protein